DTGQWRLYVQVCNGSARCGGDRADDFRLRDAQQSRGVPERGRAAARMQSRRAAQRSGIASAAKPEGPRWHRNAANRGQSRYRSRELESATRLALDATTARANDEPTATRLLLNTGRISIKSGA